MQRQRKFTFEQTIWIKENFNVNKALKILTEEFNCYFDESKTVSEIASKCAYLGLKKFDRYSSEEIDWLKENAYNYESHQDIVDAFNKMFHKNRTKYAIESALKKMGIKTGTFYTDEQLNWLRDNYHIYRTTVDLTKAFNEKFDCSKDWHLINRQCNKIGLSKNNGFSEKQKQWLINNYDKFDSVVCLWEAYNKKFNRNVHYTTVQGQCSKILNLNKDVKDKFVPNKKYKIGDEKFSQGYYFVKTKEYERTGVYDAKRQKECWEKKHYVIWKEYYNEEIPEDCIIVFLNGDKKDFDIENLYCMKRKYISYMNRNHWFSNNPEITLTAIKWCELMYATQE